ncbi:MAG: VWA domain-containing protein [Synergistaceae bacterium]|nr:VWA domain-containing protein [Synergistaceae bacterium]
MNNKNFFSFLTIMFVLFVLSFVVAGCGGGVSSLTDNPDANNSDPTDQTKSSFLVIFDSNGGTEIASQEVQSGDKAEIPDIPTKENNLFVGWYLAGENDFSFKFNFNTPIQKDTTLHAKWYNTVDTTDSDNDGLPDELEFTFGTDPVEPDTDTDGLTDYDELNWLNYNPLEIDSDGNGIPDGDEDPDKDELTNIQESNFGTNMILTDTDRDGLTDKEEVEKYKTDPLKFDTDGDGVGDGTEVIINSNPLVKETKFTTTLSTDYTKNNPQAVDISVEMTSSAENAGSLSVEAVNLIGHPMISYVMPGYINYAAYEIDTASSKDIESAKITFTLGSDYKETDDFKARIYYVNEEENVFEKLENQTVNGNKISASLTHFSTYILLNSVAFDAIWSNDIRPIYANASNDNNFLDVVFVIDGSGSMGGYYGNDPNRLALKLPQEFIDKLRDGKDRAAAVKFTSSATIVSDLTTDKAGIKAKINSIYYSGGTDGTTGIKAALDILDSSNAASKYIIFLTDGEDSYYTAYNYDVLIQKAKDNNIIIYSIGMGSANESKLKNIAESTNGKYYHATATGSVTTDDILNLDTVYQEIEKETIDYTKDSNKDGISDYYTNLILDGTLTLPDGTTMFTTIPEESKDVADWDGDGLLNGEEIYVSTIAYIEGRTQIIMKSNPLLPDSDWDGYSDYDEVKKMKTSPLKYTMPQSGSKPSTTIRDVVYDTIFPEKYLELSKERNLFTNFVQDLASTFKFDFEKVEIPKRIYMNYFNDYASGDIISKDAEAVARQTVLQYWIDGLKMAGSFLKFVKQTTNFVSDIKGGKYDEEFTKANFSEQDGKELLEKLEKESVRYGKYVEKMKKATKLDIMLIRNSFFGNTKQDELKKSLEKPNEIRKVLKEIYDAGDQFKDLSADVLGARNGFAAADKIFKTLTNVVSCTEQAAVVLDKFKKIELKGSGTWGKKALDFRKAHKTGISVGMTLVLDAVDTAVQLLEISRCYGQIQANFAEYNKNLAVLGYIVQNQDLSDYARNAANDLFRIFQSGTPNWNEFEKQIADARMKQVQASTFKLGVDLIMLGVSSACPVVGLVKGVLDYLKSEFLDGYTDALFAAQVYYGLVAGSSQVLNGLTTFLSSPYFEFEAANLSDVKNYIRTLAQSRIIGLNDVANYIVNGNTFKKIWNLFGGYEDVKEEYRQAIGKVYEFVRSCPVEISDKLPGYDYKF